jgi:threonine/homoserine/homoserine lactone efflux protein
MSLEFLITALIVVLVPGTGVVYTVSVGMTQGRRASIAAALGCTLGILPALLGAATGVAALLHASALAFQLVKIVGVVYLLYLAWRTLGDTGSPAGGSNRPRASAYVVARDGLIINILNPKLTVFFFAFLPQFIDPGAGGALTQLLLLGGVFMLMTFAVFIVYGAFAAAIGQYVLHSESALKWMRRAVAATFAGFGLRLALAER